ncbi:MAG: ABC transporter ATP-binding protein [Fibrobacteria bacterium]
MIEVTGIDKTFAPGAVPVLSNVDLSIAEGEFFCLLGPSGCGKTTLLRVVAGLEKPDAGRVKVGGKDVTAAEPHKRGCALVFQNYALWPHLTVGENIVYGLEVLRKSKPEIRASLDQSLLAYQLQGLEKRYPHELSGGQQQRVALARAMAIQPRAVLMDEPLSNLDAALRKAMRRELLDFHRRAGSTILYVTHDQEEALALSDRLAVMQAGRILELGTPAEMYARPRRLETALFLGDMNVMRGAQIPAALRSGGNGSDTLCIRPENVRIKSEGAPVLPGILAFQEFMGTHITLGVETSSGRILARVGIGGSEGWKTGAPLSLEFPEEHRLWY